MRLLTMPNFIVKRLPSALLNLRSKYFKTDTSAQGASASGRVASHIQAKYTLVDRMTPELISSALLQYLKGNIKTFAILWRDIRQRDDRIPTLEAKRVKSVSRLPYEITYIGEETPEAKKQKEILEYFFAHSTYTDCLNTAIYGGLPALIKGILLSVGYGWSVQEIVWRPKADGLSAHFIQMPLECFKQEGGTLTFLPSETATTGIPLDPREWLVSANMHPLGVASLILYYYKRNPLKDWLIYCRRFVLPAIQGKTSAVMGSTEWNNLQESLQYFGQDWAMVTGKDVDLETIDRSATGELPYENLVDRSDRCLASLWRGADLSTMSSKDATGASIQAGEGDILLEDDVTFLEDTFNMRLAPMILNNSVGPQTMLVQFKFSLPKEGIKQDLEIDKFLMDAGVPLCLADLYKRYNRAKPEEKDEIVAKIADLSTPNSSVAYLGANRSKNADRRLLQALSNDLAPLRNHINSILQLPDAELAGALADFSNAIPELFDLINERGEFEKEILEKLENEFVKGLKNRLEIEA